MEGFVSLNTQLSAYNISLRSKRFQSSNCAKVRAGAKKKVHSSFFALVPTFLDELARKRVLSRLLQY